MRELSDDWKTVGACPSPHGGIVPNFRANWIQLRVTSSLIDKQINFAENSPAGKIDLWIGSFSRGISESKLRKIISLSAGVFFQEFIDECDFLLTEIVELESLWVGADCSMPKIDLRLWPRLKSLSARYKMVRHFESLSELAELRLLGTLSVKEILPSLCAHQNLVSLALIRSTIPSLDIIEIPNGIRKLELYGMRQLKDLVSINATSTSLEVISLEACPRLVDLSILGQCRNLKHLMLYRIPPLPDLKFCENLGELSFFSFMDVNVLDGKISRLKKLPKLRYAAFTNKRHFDMKFGQLGQPGDA